MTTSNFTGDLAETADLAVTEWAPYVHSSTPHAVELGVLWCASSHLLNIPDPEGPERVALREWKKKRRTLATSGYKLADIVSEIGPVPQIPDDPREAKIPEPLGLFTSPNLAISAEGPGVGKSKFLQAVRGMAWSAQTPLLSPTLASLRDFLAQGGTMLIDEAQRTFYYGAESHREAETLLNGSFELKAGGVSKMVPGDRDGEHVAKIYPVFAPLAVAGINLRFPADVESRFIWINMTPGKVKRWDDRLSAAPFLQIGEQFRLLLRPMLGMAHEHDDEMPPELTGRLGDKWRPLIITADLIGGRWPELAREIAVTEVLDELAEAPEVPEQALLYRDCAEAFHLDEDRLRSSVLIDRLAQEHPESWGEKSGRPIKTAEALAARLRSKSFRPAKSRSNGQFRGYELASFAPGLDFYREALAHNLSDASDLTKPAPLLGSEADTWLTR